MSQHCKRFFRSATRINSISLRIRIILAAVTCMAAALLMTMAGSAADPSSGTLSVATPNLTYESGPFLVSNPSAQAAGEPICSDPEQPCDDYTLTVNVPASFENTHNVVITTIWDNAPEDYDIYLYEGATQVKSAASSSDPEIMTVNAKPGTYTVRIVPFAVAGSTTTTTIALVKKPTTVEPPPPGAGTPRFNNFPAPPTMGNSAGEPTLGSGNPITGHPDGRTMYIAGLETLRVTWFDCGSPAKPLWEDVSFPTTSTVTLDPILFTDFATGRTLVSQLSAKCSNMVYSDNDGGTNGQAPGDWIPSQGCGVNSGVDHQTVGGGPFVPGLPDGTGLYPNAVYYASQDVAVAQMALSRDGGQTFGPAVPMYDLTQCGGLHGHIKVTQDTPQTQANGHVGTLYLPNKGCGGMQAVVVSEDEGLTFEVRHVPGSSPGDTDPSVGIDNAGKIYFAFANGDGRPMVATSSDKGVTWSTPIDVGVPFGLKNTVFPAAVGGDSGRAAVMYLSTDTGGNYEALGVFKGVWHIYSAHTFDGGQTWTTVRVTPENDPVQRGSICTGGTTCGEDRNLLDFNDMEVDHEGRVIIAYADGCIGCTSPTGADSRFDKATIARQSGGKRLFAAFDPPTEPNPPAAPQVASVAKDPAGDVHVKWAEPDNGGAPITGYNVYRKIGAGSTYGAPLATVGADKTTYVDTTAAPNVQYFYRVTALNSEGEGPNCGNFPIGTVVVESECILPGLTILTDATGDALDAQPSHDVQFLAISEIFGLGGSDKIILTLKVESLAVVPPDTNWPVQFNVGATTYTARMSTVPPGTTIAPRFEYYQGAINALAPATTLADPASTFSADGTIRIVIPRSGIGNPAIGSNLTMFLTRIQVSAGAVTLTPDNMPDSLTPSGSYTIVGNAFCRPNTAPIPELLASPKQGNEPLTVNFDATGSSDPDTGAPADTIASYTFDFGDNSPPVTQASPTISHVYSAGDYRATVRVTDSRGKPSEGTAGVNIEVLPSQTKPLPPTSVVGTVVSETQVNLEWHDNANNEQGFRVERCQNEGCGNYLLIASRIANVTTYSDTGRTPNTTYRYRVRAYNNAGGSFYSIPITVVTVIKPVAPSNLVATAVGNGRVALSWEDNANNEQGSKIERCQGAGCTNFQVITTRIANIEAFTNTGLTPNTTYRYRVRAYNRAGESVSNIATVLTN